jgi:hypothetical protein
MLHGHRRDCVEDGRRQAARLARKAGRARWTRVRGFQNFEARFSRQSRPSRLSQATTIGADVFINNAGKP